MNEALAIRSRDGTEGGAASTSGAEQPLRLDRRFVLFTLLAALLLSWPLLAFGRPAYIQDSAAYYKGGRAAVSFALATLGGTEAPKRRPQSSEGPAAPSLQSEAEDVSGVRSITYSVAAYVLSAPHGTLVLLTIAQALAAGAVMVSTLGAFGGLPARRTTAAIILVAGVTTAAPVTYFAIPDIFAGLLIGSMVLLTTAAARLSWGVRLLCAAIATFAVTAHASHLPLAGGMTILGLGWVAISRLTKRPLPRGTWLWVVAPLLIGGLTALAINRVAFGETSLTSKRYPFALARSVNDGPGRWYLEKNCPKLRYAICTLYPDGLPEGGALEFLWGKDGIVERATPDQLERVRAEEAEVVLAAAREYSGHELRKLSFNVAMQLIIFEPYPYIDRLVRDDTGTPRLVPALRDNGEILRIVSILTAISAAIGTLWLCWAFFRRRSLRPVIALVMLGILGNAAVCALLSAVAHRYQARVIWLIPLFALALLGSMQAGTRQRD